MSLQILMSLKQTEGILSQNLMNDLICDKLKEIVNLQDIQDINLHCKKKSRNVYNFNEYSLPIGFLKRYKRRIFIIRKF